MTGVTVTQQLLRRFLAATAVVTLILSFVPVSTSVAHAASCPEPNPSPTKPAGEGTSAEPYKIGTAAHLMWFRDEVNSSSSYRYADLIADIDLCGVDNWVPIGTTTDFWGSFNGQFHTIRNVTIGAQSGVDQYGLFGAARTESANETEIRNLKLEVDIEIDEGDPGWVGGLAGRAGTGSGSLRIEQVSVTGTLKVTYTGTSGTRYAAGLVGQTTNNAELDNRNSFRGSIHLKSGASSNDLPNVNAGGLVGRTSNNSSVSRSYAQTAFTIDAAPQSSRNIYLGAAVGSSSTVASELIEMYASGTYTGPTQANIYFGAVGYVEAFTDVVEDFFHPDNLPAFGRTRTSGSDDWRDTERNGFVELTVAEMTGAAAEANMESEVAGRWDFESNPPIWTTVEAGVNGEPADGFPIFFWETVEGGTVAPSAPSNPVAEGIGRRATVSFAAPEEDGGSPISGYTVTASPGGATCVTSSLSCSIDDLDVDIPYTFTVRAQNVAGLGPASEPSDPLTLVAPNVPVLTAEPVVPDVSLSFDPDDQATNYAYRVRVESDPDWADNADGWIFREPASTESPWVISGLTSGETVVVQLKLVSPGFTDKVSNQQTVTPFATEAQPLNPVAEGIGRRATVSFAAPEEDGGPPIVGYTVTASPGGATCETSSLSCSIDDLDVGVAYMFTVFASTAEGRGPASDPSDPLTLVAPDVPVLTAEPVVSGVSLSFDQDNQATNYKYRVRLESDDDWENLTDGWVTRDPASTVSPWQISGLTPGVPVVVQLKLVSPGFTDKVSNQQTVTPLAPPPPPPEPEPEPESEPEPAPEPESAPAPAPEPAPAPAAPEPRPAPATVPAGPVVSPTGTAPTPSATPQARLGDTAVTVTSEPAGVTSQDGNVTVATATRLTASGVSVTLDVADAGEVRSVNGGPPQVDVARDREVTFAGSGVRGSSELAVWLPRDGSDVRRVATVVAEPDGTFVARLTFDGSGDADVDGRPLPVGEQVLQLVGVADDGQLLVIEQTITILQPDPAPEFDRQRGERPVLTPGDFFATNAGFAEVVTVIPETALRQALVIADDWSMAVDVGDGVVNETADGGALIELVRDRRARVSGDGFMPGTRADVWVFSEPVLLGSVTIGPDGTFLGEVEVDGEQIAVGEHTMQLQGVGRDGYVRAANLGVVVIGDDVDTSAPVTDDAAATGATGDSGGVPGGVLLLVVLLGVSAPAIELLRRRRKLF